VRALDLPARVSAGARAREYQWVPDATGRGRLLPLDPGRTWGPDADPPPPPDDGGGLAGVREPRRPKPSPGSAAASLEEPRQVLDDSGEPVHGFLV
jgi:hypothetical protein